MQVNPKQLEEDVGELKRAKATAKTTFTQARRCLLIIVQSEVIDNEDISEKFDDALETAMRVMITKYKKDKDAKSADKLSGVIEQIEIE